METKLRSMDSSYLATYNPSLNVYKDVMKKNNAWEEVAELGAPGEWM